MIHDIEELSAKLDGQILLHFRIFQQGPVKVLKAIQPEHIPSQGSKRAQQGLLKRIAAGIRIGSSRLSRRRIDAARSRRRNRRCHRASRWSKHQLAEIPDDIRPDHIDRSELNEWAPIKGEYPIGKNRLLNSGESEAA